MSKGGYDKLLRKYQESLVSNQSLRNKLSECEQRTDAKADGEGRSETSRETTKGLGRSSFEAYGFFILGGIYTVVSAFGLPVNFWIGLCMSLFMSTAAVDLLWRSAWTATWNKRAKLAGTLLIVLLLVVVVNQGYVVTHLAHTPDTASAVNNLANAVGSLRDSLTGVPRQTVIEVDSNRPKMVLEAPRAISTPDGRHILNLKAVNLGLAIAKSQITTTGMFVGPTGKQAEDAIFRTLHKRQFQGDGQPITQIDQLPGPENYIIIPIGGDPHKVSGEPIDAEDRMDIYQKQKALYAAVLLTYQDNKGTIYHTELCYREDDQADQQTFAKLCIGHNGGN